MQIEALWISFVDLDWSIILGRSRRAIDAAAIR